MRYDSKKGNYFSEAQRAQVLTLLALGVKPAEVCRLVGMVPGTAYRLWNRAVARGFNPKLDFRVHEHHVTDPPQNHVRRCKRSKGVPGKCRCKTCREDRKKARESGIDRSEIVYTNGPLLPRREEAGPETGGVTGEQLPDYTADSGYRMASVGSYEGTVPGPEIGQQQRQSEPALEQRQRVPISASGDSASGTEEDDDAPD